MDLDPARYDEFWRRGFATHWASHNVVSSGSTIDEGYYNKNPQLYAESLAAASA